MIDSRGVIRRLFVSAALLSKMSAQFVLSADTNTTTSPRPAAEKRAAQNPRLAMFARSHGFNACSTELEALDQNLFADSDYSRRGFIAENNINSKPFSAIIDSRKTGARGGYVRARTNVVI